MVRNSMSSLVIVPSSSSPLTLLSSALCLVNLLVFVHTLYMCMCASRC